jgi:DNA modification methylase
LKSKDLIGIPWMLAFALRADGSYLRSEIIWHKPNPMPESVKDRPTKAHEQIFLLSKSPKYCYNYEAIKEPFVTDPRENYPRRAHVTGRGAQPSSGAPVGNPQQDRSGGFPPSGDGRNKRSVWTMTTRPFRGAHFAVFPSDLPKACLLAGCPEGGVVLDPVGDRYVKLEIARSIESYFPQCGPATYSYNSPRSGYCSSNG